MKIEIQIGNAILQVGEPSPNHLTIRTVETFPPKENPDPPTFGIGEWRMMKTTVDKIFEAASVLSTPPKLG